MSTQWARRAASLAVLVALAAWPALADSHARIVRLSFLSGDVQMDRNLGSGFEKAILNTPLTEGMKLQTGSNSLAEVEFEDGTTMRLAPDSAVEFPQLALGESGGKLTTVQANDGTVYFNVIHKGDDRFQVRFADRSIDLTRAAHFRLDISPTDVQVAVFKGKVPVQGPGSTLVEVKSHEDVTLYEGGSGKYELAKSYSPDQYDSWDNDRIEYQKDYSKGLSSYNLPAQYGISDLSYYGSWYSYPGYGYLWRPYGVAYSWDPFYSGGSWAYYPGFGYTFVSNYAWGWMPYRYGAWAFVPGFGWGWQPGNVTVWNPTPRVINPPHGWIPPKPPSGGNVIANGGGTGPAGRGPVGDPAGPAGTASTFTARTPRIPPSLRATVPVGPPPAGVTLPPQERMPRWGARGPRAVEGEGMRAGRPMPMPVPRSTPHVSAAPPASAPRMSAPAPRMSAPAGPRMSAPAGPRSAPSPHVGATRVPH